MRKAQSHPVTNSALAPFSFPGLQTDFSKSTAPPSRDPHLSGASASHQELAQPCTTPSSPALRNSLPAHRLYSRHAAARHCSIKGRRRRRRTAAWQPGATFPPLLSSLPRSKESPLSALQKRVADRGSPGQQKKGCPRGDGCIADTAQGRGTPAAETVSKEAPSTLAKNRSLLDSPSGPGNRALQSGNFLQPCRSATSATSPALAPGKWLQVGKAARWPPVLGWRGGNITEAAE